MWDLSKASADPAEQANGSSVGEGLPWLGDRAADAPASKPEDGVERVVRLFAIAGAGTSWNETDQ